jgi:tRNA-2-methylthio-N6-dimethylallyladenosine synthase
MNNRDSEAATALLSAHGYRLSRSESDADILIINTCSVRAKAEEKALGKAGLMVASKAKRSHRIVGLIGCMVQRLKSDVVKRVAGLDFAVAPQDLARLPAVIDDVRAGQAPIVMASEMPLDPEKMVDHVPDGVTAFISIQIGCDRQCAYCVVPSVRGREWSRPAHYIVEEVQRVVAAGIKEVTLLGQSVTAYGQSNPVWPDDYISPHGYREPLVRLLEAVDSIPGIARVRFTSAHPSGCTEELARAMGELPTVCPHLHLPLQSGSDRILKMMRRGYSAAEYRQAIERIRHRLPLVALTADVIVGFPTETSADFDTTRRLMEEIGFANAFIFKYSPRPGTPAAELPDDVPETEKRRRNHELLIDQERRSIRINSALIGQTVEILIEGVSARNVRRWSGRSRANAIIVFDYQPGIRPGQLQAVRIDHVTAQALYGGL